VGCLIDCPAATQSGQPSWLVATADVKVGMIANKRDCSVRSGTRQGRCAVLAAASFDVASAVFKLAKLFLVLSRLPFILEAEPERYAKPDWRQ